MFEPVPAKVDDVATKILDAAFEVHRALGPGLMEGVYEACMCRELSHLGLAFQSQLVLPVTYRGTRLDAGLRVDLLVEECVIVELKAVES